MSAEHANNNRRSFTPDFEVVLLAWVATLTVQAFRAPSHRWILLLWVETAFFVLLPLLAFFCTRNRLSRLVDSGNKRTLAFTLQAGAILAALLALLIQWISRQTGMGDANEIVILLVIQSVTLFLAVFSKFGSFGKVTLLLSGSLVLFVCFMAEMVAVYLLTFIYATTALWWMLGNYWNRLNVKALDSESKTLPVNTLAIGITVLLVSATGAITWAVVPNTAKKQLLGFMPFSGGERGQQSEFARSGIGDGNMLMASDNATTTGPVDSDQFIEDDKPSIYDITTEKFEGPLKIKKHKNRAISLDKKSKHLHEVIQSEQAGKLFRTVREQTKETDLKLEDRISKALFFVEGSAPARFYFDSFQHFDGFDWKKVGLKKSDFRRPSIKIERHFGKPWYVIRNLERDYLPVTRQHRIKVMRLKNDVLPASPLVRAWHIGQAEDPSLFYWNESGLVRMGGDFIPGQTVIDTVANVPNFHTLRASANNKLFQKPKPIWQKEILSPEPGTEKHSGSLGSASDSSHSESPFLQLPKNETTRRLGALAKDWTEGTSPGWRQVEIIINRIRNDYVSSSELIVSPDAKDSIGAFLDQGGGTDYMFATTATQILRAAGYQTRLVRGFHVGSDDYDRVANQSLVTSENLHMWPEVSIDGHHWIPLEPNPEYPIPFSHQTVWQWAKASLIAAGKYLLEHPIATLSTIAAVVGVFYFRKLIWAMGYWLFWWLASNVKPSSQLSITRKLIDLRFWATDFARPASTPISDWWSQVDSEACQEFCRYWQIDIYSSRSLDDHSQSQIKRACRNLVSEFSMRNIRSQATPNTTEISS